MKVCRICITKDDKLYPISSNGLRPLYHQLTGAHNLADETLPEWVCEECGLRLMSYDKLRQKCLKSQNLLRQLLENVTFIAEEDLIQANIINNLQTSYAANNDDSIQEDRQAVPDLTEFHTENKHEDLNEINLTKNDLQSNSIIIQTLIEHENSHKIIVPELITENITEEDLNEIHCRNNVFKSNFINTVVNNCSLLESLDISEPGETVRQPKIKEFVIDLNVEESASIFKINNDAFNKNPSETEDTDTDILSGSENGFLSDAANQDDNDFTDLISLTTKDDENSNIVNEKCADISSTKTKNKTKTLNIMKPIDNNMDLFQEKIPQIRNKKAVDKKKVNKKTVSKKKVVEKVGESLPFDEFITVHTLSLEEQKAEFVKRKYSSNYTESPYKCHDCYKGFATAAVLARHKFMHSDKWGKLECHICKRRHNTNDNYNTHINSHKYVFSCKECMFKTRLRSLAVKHLMKHRVKVYKCSLCEAKFKTKSNYFYHRRIKHVSKFVCEYCGFSFVSARGVEQHKYRIHRFDKRKKKSELNRPTCAACKICFVSDKALDTHIKVSHPKKSDIKVTRNSNDNKKGPIMCELCGMKIAYKSYNKHIRRHDPFLTENTTNEDLNPPRPPTKKYICDQCGKVFNTKYHQKQHKVVHTKVKAYECDHCHRMYGTKQAIKLHIENLHLPKKHIIQPKEYPCSRCDNKYKTKYSRKRHMTTHTGLLSYPCRICGKVFAQRGSRNRHNLTAHSSQSPSHACHICSKTFTTKYKVKEHLLHIHLNVPRPKRKRQGDRTSV